MKKRTNWPNKQQGSKATSHPSCQPSYNPSFQTPRQLAKLISPSELSVGCIYASNPQYKSNIFWCLSNSFKLLSKYQNHSKIFFLNFLYFYWHLFERHSIFYSTYCTKVCTFASTSRFDSESRKHLLAHWLIPTGWLCANLGTKVLGEQVYASETKLVYALSPRCVHSLRRCSFRQHIFTIELFHSLRSCTFRPKGQASSNSC